MISPMTTWLRGGRSRKFSCTGFTPQMNGDCVQITLFESNCSVAGARGPTVEEAMAHVLNTLMAAQGDPNAGR